MTPVFAKFDARKEGQTISPQMLATYQQLLQEGIPKNLAAQQRQEYEQFFKQMQDYLNQNKQNVMRLAHQTQKKVVLQQFLANVVKSFDTSLFGGDQMSDALTLDNSSITIEEQIDPDQQLYQGCTLQATCYFKGHPYPLKIDEEGQVYLHKTIQPREDNQAGNAHFTSGMDDTKIQLASVKELEEATNPHKNTPQMLNLLEKSKHLEDFKEKYTSHLTQVIRPQLTHLNSSNAHTALYNEVIQQDAYQQILNAYIPAGAIRPFLGQRESKNILPSQRGVYQFLTPIDNFVRKQGAQAIQKLADLLPRMSKVIYTLKPDNNQAFANQNELLKVFFQPADLSTSNLSTQNNAYAQLMKLATYGTTSYNKQIDLEVLETMVDALERFPHKPESIREALVKRGLIPSKTARQVLEAQGQTSTATLTNGEWVRERIADVNTGVSRWHALQVAVTALNEREDLQAQEQQLENLESGQAMGEN